MATIAFEALKQALTEAPILHAADTAKPFLLSTDASNVGIGAALEQDSKKGIVSVAFYSRKLKQCEKNMKSQSWKHLPFTRQPSISLLICWAATQLFTDHIHGNHEEIYPKMAHGAPAISADWKGEGNVVADALRRSPVDGHNQNEERVFLNQKAQFHSFNPGGKC